MCRDIPCPAECRSRGKGNRVYTRRGRGNLAFLPSQARHRTVRRPSDGNGFPGRCGRTNAPVPDACRPPVHGGSRRSNGIRAASDPEETPIGGTMIPRRKAQLPCGASPCRCPSENGRRRLPGTQRLKAPPHTLKNLRWPRTLYPDTFG